MPEPRTTTASKRTRQCPRCRSTIRSRKRCSVCNVSLVKTRWQLTPARIRGLRAIAHGRKGLDEETYHLRLNALGLTTTKDLTQDLYYQFRRGLLSLPDRPDWAEKRAGRNQESPAEIRQRMEAERA